MKVYKFGGASVKNSEAIENLKKIVEGTKGKLIIIVSALGKTTNKLEKLLDKFLAGNANLLSDFDSIKEEHIEIANQLFNSDNEVFEILNEYFDALYNYILIPNKTGYDYNYDQIVHFGEIFSTIIVSEYLNLVGYENDWVDIREIIKTNSNFREGIIDWDLSEKNVKNTFHFEDVNCYVSQGFIASNENNEPTTLGREGSDYSAAVIANMLDAESLTIWKDVPGVLNADPKFFSETQRIRELSYLEAVELAFSGAQVIHPKTIKPLQNKQIPLIVKSFIEPNEKGTLIQNDTIDNLDIPICIVKRDQLLLTLKPKDYSFVMEEGISSLFKLFFDNRIKVNLIQTSAISFSLCVDDEKQKLRNLLEHFKGEYTILYNENVELFTVRHYNDEYLRRLIENKEILLEQKSRNTIRFIAKLK